MRWRMTIAALALLAPSLAPAQPAGQPLGRVTGIGGVFVRSPDPKALAAWYRDVLGLELQAWGGAKLDYSNPARPPAAVWSAFPERTGYFAPSTREVMIDLSVDDLDAVLARAKAKGVPILERDDSQPNGRFAWIMDPDGTKIELWQPKRP